MSDQDGPAAETSRTRESGRPGRSDTTDRRPPRRTDGGRADPAGGPSLARRFGVFVVGVFLTLSLVATTGVLAAQGTVLDPGYMTEKADESDTSAALERRAEDAVLQSVDLSLGGAGYIPATDLAESTVRELITESYVRGQLVRNVDRLYGYLHGERDRLELAANTTPVVSAVRPTVREQLEQTSVPELLSAGAFADGLAVGDYSVDGDTLARAYENESVYRDQQSTLRPVVEGTPVTRDDINETVVSNTEPGVRDLPPDVQESVFDLQRVFVLGFTSDMSHDEFRDRVDAARADLYDSIARFAQTRLDEQVPERVVFTEGLSESDRATANRAAEGVQTLTTLGTVLPVLVVLLVAVVALLTHSVSRTARTVGVSALLVGVLGYAAVRLVGPGARRTVRETLSAPETAFLADTAVAVVDGFLGTLAAHYVVLVAAGAGLFAVYLVVDRRQPDAIPAAWR